MFAETQFYFEVPIYYTWNTLAKKFQCHKQGKEVEAHINLYSTDSSVHYSSKQYKMFLLAITVDRCAWIDIFRRIENSERSS